MNSQYCPPSAPVVAVTIAADGAVIVGIACPNCCRTHRLHVGRDLSMASDYIGTTRWCGCRERFRITDPHRKILTKEKNG